MDLSLNYKPAAVELEEKGSVSKCASATDENQKPRSEGSSRAETEPPRLGSQPQLP